MEEDSLAKPMLLPFQIEDSVCSRSNLKINFRKKGFMSVRDIMLETCPELMSEEYAEKHKKDLSKTVFELEVATDNHTWTIMRRIEDFIHLEKSLKGRHSSKVMGIPVRKESENENSQLLLEFFELFLQQISRWDEVKRDSDYLLFVGIPVVEERRKLKVYSQGFLKKRSGGRHNEGTCRRCSTWFGNWKKRFFTVTSQGIFYSVGYQPGQSHIKEMIPFSFHFSIEYGMRSTGLKFGLVLNSCQRNLQLLSDDLFTFLLFIHSVKKSLSENHYLEINRYGSFARERQNCQSKFYVDGQDYFQDIYDELLKAKKEVFITGWMITPFFLLVRPNGLDSETRFDKVLTTIAQRGVKVNIVVFLEPKLALNNDSEYTKHYLQSLHSNIRVLRHPNFILIPFLWSHHEKMVIVDQHIGFLGGLDICYGRMDNQKHLLSDRTEADSKFWEGADYANFRISDIYTPRQYQTSMIDSSKLPRMPWHDIAVQIRGQSVIDLTRHFVQYWNFVNFQTQFDDRELLLQAGITKETHDTHQKQTIARFRDSVRKFQDEEYYKKLKGAVVQEKKSKGSSKEPDLKSRSVSDASVLLKSEYAREQPSKLYSNRERSYSFSVDEQIRRLQTIAAEDQAEKQFYRQYLSKLEREQDQSLYKNFNAKLGAQFQKLKNMRFNPFRSRQAITEQLLVFGQPTAGQGTQRHQMLRSASTWGLGIEQGNEEKSIYNAYIELISQAKEFIYIENQFFISVENKVCQALALRIEKAHQQGKPFKVVVVLPLLPGFEGEIDQESAAVLRIQMHLQYHTICRGENSLFERLKHIDNFGQYIQFYCLRNHDTIHGQPVTEIIYVHSKLMIVDDEKALIGSANINDRSMLGSRDSQIAIIIEDTEKVVVKGQHTRLVGKSVHELRVKLYMEHFALSNSEAKDYWNESVWWLVKERAKKNTLMYREIFACYPDDEAKDLIEFKSFQKGRNYDRYEILKEAIVGHVVEFPACFMANERLTLKPSQKEFYVPEVSFT